MYKWAHSFWWLHNIFRMEILSFITSILQLMDAMDWMFMSPLKFICWNPNGECDGIWRWYLGRYLGHEGGVFTNGISDLIQEKSQRASLPPPPLEREDSQQCQRQLSPDTPTGGALILNFNPSWTIRHECLLFISHTPDGISLQQPSRLTMDTVFSKSIWSELNTSEFLRYYMNQTTFSITIGNTLKPLLNVESEDRSRKRHSVVSVMLEIKIIRQKKLSTSGHGWAWKQTSHQIFALHGSFEVLSALNTLPSTVENPKPVVLWHSLLLLFHLRISLFLWDVLSNVHSSPSCVSGIVLIL